jgi:hypothetical protein
MCDRYSSKYGYICHECFKELVQSGKTIDEFMDTPKNGDFKDEFWVRYNMLDEEFPFS